MCTLDPSNMAASLHIVQSSRHRPLGDQKRGDTALSAGLWSIRELVRAYAEAQLNYAYVGGTHSARSIVWPYFVYGAYS